MKLISIERVSRSEPEQYRLKVEHGFWIFTWVEEYITDGSEIPGCWEWRRIPEMTVITNLDLLETLDFYVMEFIDDEEILRATSEVWACGADVGFKLKGKGYKP